MKHITALACIILLSFSFFLFSCENKDQSSSSSSFLDPGKMVPDTYVISVDRDTTIETKNGALLKIPAGSLTVENGTTASLEIKEAYTMQAMVLAGLTTTTNGEPLSSGGMISIQAAAGQKVTISKPIKVALPASHLDKSMELYKGEEKADGTVNWKDPQPLPANETLAAVDSGAVLFNRTCASCHLIDREGTGPALAHFLKRFPWGESSWRYSEHYNAFGTEWKSDTIPYYELREFIYKCNLHDVYKSSGPRYIASDSIDGYREELFKIYRYIQNESDRLNLPMPWQTSLKECADSCEAYNIARGRLEQLKSMTKAQRRAFIETNDPLVVQKPDATWDSGPAAKIDMEQRVSPSNPRAVYYQFTIESFGWYNIDSLLEETDGVSESELTVRIRGQHRETVKVYLIIPSSKVYGEGGPTGNDDEFAFFYKTGKLPLPQKAKAYILAMAEAGDSIAFGIEQFTTSTKQHLELSLQSSSTKEAFTAAISTLNFDNLDITVADSKNATSIRATDVDLKKIDEELKLNEKLRPLGCNCDCGGARK